MSGPAVTIVAAGKGLGVKPIDNGPVFTVVDKGGFAISIDEVNGVGWTLEGLTPAVPTFQQFTLTAGSEGQWIGYSNGVAPQPQPAFGSISQQPSEQTTLLSLYDDTASNVFLASFSGNFVDAFQGLQMSIGGFVVDEFEVQLISGTTWVRFTGIPGNLTAGANYEVIFGFDLVPSVVLWTLDDIPAEYRVNGALWEARNAQIASGNQVSAVIDTWGVRNAVQATAGGQPFFGQRDGYDAIIWPDTAGSRRLVSTSAFAPAYFFAVMAYNDGVRATFLGSVVILGFGSGSGRIIGEIGTANLRTVVNNGWAETARINGGAEVNSILPLSRSVVEFSGTPLSGTWAMGGENANAAMQGPFFLVGALGTAPTTDLRQRIEGRLAWQYGLQTSLPSGHPYRNQPPTRPA